MNKKFKSIMNVLLDVVIVLFLVFAALILVVSLSQKVEKPGSVSQIFGYTFRNIQSESMEAYDENGKLIDGAFCKGDIVICKVTNNANETYEVGDTVLFQMPVKRNDDGTFTECAPHESLETVYVTHNIVEITTSEDGTTLYRTQGINEHSLPDLNYKDASEIKAVYTGVRLAGFGAFSNFVQSGLGFFLCIILPIAIFVIIQTIRVIRNFIAYKAQKVAVAASGELSEEQKKLIAEEYLKQQKAAEDDTASSTVDTADDE
ncbi:MAG: hypothetical protein IJA62_05605 [Ruminococcus sp.]|nr:hypothetical protein [Ruminococcus sp.]